VYVRGVCVCVCAGRGCWDGCWDGCVILYFGICCSVGILRLLGLKL